MSGMIGGLQEGEEGDRKGCGEGQLLKNNWGEVLFMSFDVSLTKLPALFVDKLGCQALLLLRSCDATD